MGAFRQRDSYRVRAVRLAPGLRSRMEDIGRRAVDGLFEQLRVDDEWSTREDRMFSWLAHRLQQTVRAPPPFTEGSLVLVRLEAHTVIVDKVTADKQSVSRLLA